MFSNKGNVPEAGRFWLEISGFLVAGNLASLLNWYWQIPINSGGASIVLALFIYGYVGWRQRGVGWSFWTLLQPGKLFLAIGAGVLLTLPPLLFFLFPVVVSDLDYSPVKAISLGELLYRTLIAVPLFTAFSEELFFRGYLYRYLEKLPTSRAIGLNAFIFTLWHLVVVLRTVLDTNLAANSWLLLFSYLGSLGAVLVGGIIFSLVRRTTGSFWFSGLTHWLNVALMNAIIWLS